MHAAIATGLIAAAAACLVGCGGSVSSTSAGRPDATASDASSAEGPDASIGLMGASGAADAGVDGSVLVEAGFVDADVIHREAGSTCPTARGAGAISCPDMDGGSCTSNADCDGGVNGRCLRASNPLPCGGAVSCSYDECFMDSDCPAVPCSCRSSDTDPSPNVCVTGSGCTVDSDCGPGGLCSPSAAPDTVARCWALGATYQCHTPSDQCLTNADCIACDGGVCRVRQCSFESTTKRWTCQASCIAPP